MIEHPVLQHRIGGEPGLEELAMTLRELVGSPARLVTAFKLDRGVYRIWLATPSRMLSLVAKRLAAPVAYRNQLALECWLPAEAQGAPRLITGSDPRLAERGAA